MSNALPVACFAPPLTDNQLAEYEAIVSKTESGDVRDAILRCSHCTGAWWELPESRRPAEKPQTFLHRGREIRVAFTPLEKEHIRQLWDATPWMDELNEMHSAQGDGLLDRIDAPAARRNGLRAEAWHSDLWELALREAFAPDVLEWLRSRRRLLLLDLLNTVTKSGEQDAAMTNSICEAFGLAAQQHAEQVAAVEAVRQRVVRMANGEEPPVVARPSLEDTRLRNAAFHLLWHAKEITLDREPMTLDKLGA